MSNSMELRHILLTSTIFMIMSIFLIISHHIYRNLNYRQSYRNENFSNKDIERIDIRDHSTSDFDNPEIPYAVTNRYFVLGGFCMQWGRTNSDDISFHFPFDKVFIGYGTVAKRTDKWENLKVRSLKNDKMTFAYSWNDSYWLAIGLKINPIDNVI